MSPKEERIHATTCSNQSTVLHWIYQHLDSPGSGFGALNARRLPLEWARGANIASDDLLFMGRFVRSIWHEELRQAPNMTRTGQLSRCAQSPCAEEDCIT